MRQQEYAFPSKLAHEVYWMTVPHTHLEIPVVSMAFPVNQKRTYVQTLV